MGEHTEFMKRLRSWRDCENWHLWMTMMSAMNVWDAFPDELQEWVREKVREQLREERAGK